MHVVALKSYGSMHCVLEIFQPFSIFCRCSKLKYIYNQGGHSFKHMPFFCYRLSVVEAADFSNKYFMEWVEGAVFTPAQVIKIKSTL